MQTPSMFVRTPSFTFNGRNQRGGACSAAPTMQVFRSVTEEGGLVSYGPNYLDLWRRATELADKILRGTKPADIPVEQPAKFELVVNLKTAKALGLTIPETFLTLADEVIE